MISLEQIRQLESRVHSAVERIRALTAENSNLKDNLARYESRIDELEKLVNDFKSEQAEIEAGIIAALSQLDGLEDTVAEPAATEPPPVVKPLEPADPPADPPATPEISDQVGESETTAPDPAEPAAGNLDEEEPELDIF